MAQHIAAVFTSRESSSAAESRLRSEGFSCRLQPLGASPEQVTPPTGAQSPDLEGAADTAPGIQWIVTVEAPFGRAKRAIALLAAFHPATIHENDHNLLAEGMRGGASVSHGGKPAEAEARVVRSPDHSFFMSTLLGLPLLVDCPAPLSSLLGLPTLIRE